MLVSNKNPNINIIVSCKGNRKTIKTILSVYIYIHIPKLTSYIRMENNNTYLYMFTYMLNYTKTLV